MINSDKIFKEKLQVLADMQHAFYVDFMPIFQQIQEDIATLEVVEKDFPAITRINENLSKAVNLLEFLNKQSNLTKDKIND